MTAAAIATPLRAEWIALRPASTPRVHTGMGPRRSMQAARRLDGRALVVAGVGGGLGAGVAPGDIVVATEVRGPEGGSVGCPSAPLLAEELRRLGLRVHSGPVLSMTRIVAGAQRHTLAGTGALAVDTESAWLAPPAGTGFAVVRAISDTQRAPLFSPGIVASGFAALRTLRRAVPALDRWAAAVGPRQLLLAGPPRESELVLVLGSANSSNSQRLVEVAEREGVPARLIDDASALGLADLAGVTRVGITAGVSAPPRLVDDLISCLAGLGAITVRAANAPAEDIHVTLPKEVS